MVRREERLETLLFKVLAANGICTFALQKNLLVGRSLNVSQINSDITLETGEVHVMDAKGLDELCAEIEKEIKR